MYPVTDRGDGRTGRPNRGGEMFHPPLDNTRPEESISSTNARSAATDPAAPLGSIPIAPRPPSGSDDCGGTSRLDLLASAGCGDRDDMRRASPQGGGGGPAPPLGGGQPSPLPSYGDDRRVPIPPPPPLPPSAGRQQGRGGGGPSSAAAATHADPAYPYGDRRGPPPAARTPDQVLQQALVPHRHHPYAAAVDARGVGVVRLSPMPAAPLPATAAGARHRRQTSLSRTSSALAALPAATPPILPPMPRDGTLPSSATADATSAANNSIRMLRRQVELEEEEAALAAEALALRARKRRRWDEVAALQLRQRQRVGETMLAAAAAQNEAAMQQRETMQQREAMQRRRVVVAHHQQMAHQQQARQQREEVMMTAMASDEMRLAEEHRRRAEDLYAASAAGRGGTAARRPDHGAVGRGRDLFSSAASAGGSPLGRGGRSAVEQRPAAAQGLSVARGRGQMVPTGPGTATFAGRGQSAPPAAAQRQQLRRQLEESADDGYYSRVLGSSGRGEGPAVTAPQRDAEGVASFQSAALAAREREALWAPAGSGGRGGPVILDPATGEFRAAAAVGRVLARPAASTAASRSQVTSTTDHRRLATPPSGPPMPSHTAGGAVSISSPQQRQRQPMSGMAPDAEEEERRRLRAATLSMSPRQCRAALAAAGVAEEEREQHEARLRAAQRLGLSPRPPPQHPHRALDRDLSMPSIPLPPPVHFPTGSAEAAAVRRPMRPPLRGPIDRSYSLGPANDDIALLRRHRLAAAQRDMHGDVVDMTAMGHRSDPGLLAGMAPGGRGMAGGMTDRERFLLDSDMVPEEEAQRRHAAGLTMSPSLLQPLPPQPPSAMRLAQHHQEQEHQQRALMRAHSEQQQALMQAHSDQQQRHALLRAHHAGRLVPGSGGNDSFGSSSGVSMSGGLGPDRSMAPAMSSAGGSASAGSRPAAGADAATLRGAATTMQRGGPAAAPPSKPAYLAPAAAAAREKKKAASAPSGSTSVARLQPEAAWQENYRGLRSFRDEHGHVDVTKVHGSSHPLARWTTNQRRECKAVADEAAHREARGGVDAAGAAAPPPPELETVTRRMALLDSIGFELDRHRSRWEKRFEELRAYRDNRGHCNVPQRCRDNPSLGRWVNTQRRQQRMRSEGRDSDMTEERYRRLSELGMVWYVKGPDQWRERFEDLRAYRCKVGHCDVPSRYEPDRMLGRWVSSQRIQYKLKKEGKHSYLSDERVRAMNGIGFDWRTESARGMGAGSMGRTIAAELAARDGASGAAPELEENARSILAPRPPPSRSPAAASQFHGAFRAAATAASFAATPQQQPSPSAAAPGMLETSASSMEISASDILLNKSSVSSMEASTADLRAGMSRAAIAEIPAAGGEGEAATGEGEGEDTTMGNIREEEGAAARSSSGAAASGRKGGRELSCGREVEM